MYKEDLVLNNLQGLICHKTPLNQNKQKMQTWSYNEHDLLTYQHKITLDELIHR